MKNIYLVLILFGFTSGAHGMEDPKAKDQKTITIDTTLPAEVPAFSRREIAQESQFNATSPKRCTSPRAKSPKATTPHKPSLEVIPESCASSRHPVDLAAEFAKIKDPKAQQTLLIQLSKLMPGRQQLGAVATIAKQATTEPVPGEPGGRTARRLSDASLAYSVKTHNILGKVNDQNKKIRNARANQIESLTRLTAITNLVNSVCADMVNDDSDDEKDNSVPRPSARPTMHDSSAGIFGSPFASPSTSAHQIPPVVLPYQSTTGRGVLYMSSTALGSTPMSQPEASAASSEDNNQPGSCGTDKK